MRNLAFDHDGDGIFLKHRPDNRVTFSQLALGYAYPNGSAIGVTSGDGRSRRSMRKA